MQERDSILHMSLHMCNSNLSHAYNKYTYAHLINMVDFRVPRYNMSRVIGKPDFYIILCKNKGADQLRGNRAAVQHLYFHYIDSTIVT